MVAEPRDLDAQHLGGSDHQRALWHGELDAVDGDADRFGLAHLGHVRAGSWRVRGSGHHVPPAKMVAASGSKGQPPYSRWARYSLRKYWIDDVIGLTAPSPSAQNARPRM